MQLNNGFIPQKDKEPSNFNEVDHISQDKPKEYNIGDIVYQKGYPSRPLWVCDVDNNVNKTVGVCDTHDMKFFVLHFDEIYIEINDIPETHLDAYSPYRPLEDDYHSMHI